MRVAILTLADHAVAADDGRIYMIGGGIDRLAAGVFPAVVPHLSLAVKFLMSPEERSQEHSVQVRLMDPAGHPIMAPMGLLIPTSDQAGSPASKESTQVETPYQFVYNMRDLRFEAQGAYWFSVELDSRELGPLALHLEQSTVPSLSLRNQQDTLSRELVLGYQLFAAGDLPRAQSTFERLVRLFPHSPDAHNNLAYLLLASGNPQAALPEFHKAIELRHTQVELVMANIACCQFLLGDAATALATFKSLFRGALRGPQATLFGLGHNSMQPVFLFSQGDYLALMQLNAARCAERLRRTDEARHLAAMADVGLLTFQSETRAAFVSLLDELKRDLSMTSSPAPKRR
jgi:tetratricopeptide (TPR) repeat protein